MIDKLKQIEDKLILELLSQSDVWNFIIIDDQKPIIEKAYTKINKHIISLSFIHSCEKELVDIKLNEAPSAVHILQGSYEISFNNSGIELLTPQGGLYFDMTSKDITYRARSLKSASSFVMLSGEPWEANEKEEGLEKNPTHYGRKTILLEYFLNYYRAIFQNKRVEENINIQKGDWVEFDKPLMSEYEKKGYLAILDKKGFVIKATETLVDARFGNDRVQVKSQFLKRLYTEQSQKPVDATKAFEGEIDKDDEDFDPDFL